MTSRKTPEKINPSEKSNSRNWGMIFLIAAVVLLGFVPLFTGRTLYEEDGLFYFLPAFKFYWDALHSGQSFLITPQVFSGFPLYLSQIGGFVEPLNYLLFSVLPFPFVYFLRIFISYLSAAVLMYLFSRELGLSREAAFLSTLAFLSSQQILGGTQVIRSFSAPFLVGIFYVALKFFRIRPIRLLPFVGIAALGAVIFLNGMLGGYMQLNLHALVGLGLFVIFLAWQDAKKGVNLSYPSVSLLGLAGAFSVGFAFFYPYLSRVLELLPLTARGGGVSWQEAGGATGPFTVIPAVINKITALSSLFFLPTFRMPENLGGGFFVGFVAVVAVMISFFLKKNKEWFFFFALLIFSVLATMPPLSWLFFTQTPFRYFRNVGFWQVFPGTFAFSMLAGLGLDAFRGLGTGEERAKIFLRVMPLALGLLVVYLLFLIFSMETNLKVFNTLRWSDIIISLAVWAAVFVWCWLISFAPQKKTIIRVLFIASCAASFVIPIWVLSYRSSTSVRTSSIFQTPVVYQEIGRREGDNIAFRTFNFYPGDSQWHLFVKVYDPTVQMLHDFQREVAMQRLSPALHEYASIRGLDNLVPSRYLRTLNYIDTQKTFSDAYAAPLDGSHPVFLIDAKIFELLGMMGVKYMWTMLPLSPELEDSFIDQIFAATSTKSDIALYLYENKRFIPKVSSPSHIALLEESDDSFKEIVEPGFDFHSIGFIECKGCGKVRVVSQSPPDIHEASFKNDLVSFRTSGKEDAWVIVANSFIPRWHAFIDDKEAGISIANHIYQGILVPAGEHSVTLRYKW